MEQKPLITSLRVADERNSFTYGTALHNLDWDNWSIDTGEYGEYLRLLVRHKELGVSVKVCCKVTDHPRVAFKDGELYWLVLGVTLGGQRTPTQEIQTGKFPPLRPIPMTITRDETRS